MPEHEPLAMERLIEDAQRGEKTRNYDTGGALDVVVEARDPVAEPVEDTDGVVLLEVLPLEDGMREGLAHCFDEFLHELVVGRPAEAGMPVPDVHRVVEKVGVVRPDIEGHRQSQRWIDTGAGRVKGELPNRDPHPARTLVAEAQDALVVSGHDEPDIAIARVMQQLDDSARVERSDPQSASAAHHVAELLACPPDRRRVHDWHELFDIVHEEPVEERFVSVLQRGEADVLLQLVRLAANVLEFQRLLLLDAHDPRREEPAEAETVSLFGREP